MDGKTYGLPLTPKQPRPLLQQGAARRSGRRGSDDVEELSAAAKATANGDVSGLAISAVKNEQGPSSSSPSSGRREATSTITRPPVLRR